MNKEIEILIIRFLNKSATSSDLDVLNNLIQNPENNLVFEEYIKTHFAIIIGTNNPDISEISKNLSTEIRKDKNVFFKKRLLSITKYAAIIIFCIGVGYFLKNSFNNLQDTIIPDEGAITLQLDNGDIEVISEGGESKVLDAQGKLVGVKKGTRLVYDIDSTNKKLHYNTLKVPYGKRFDIVLSDGTNIFLNSGSSIKYPVNFIPGKLREVYLEGEAYFDVTHDKKHPFIVNAQEMNVEVLGTKFNLSNYPEDKQTDVVLVTGSVSLYSNQSKIDDEKKVLLEPGFKGSFNKTEKNITTKKVNTSIYTSWIGGNIVFRNTPFKNIIKKLERTYNVIIINNNENLSMETFNATIDSDSETIEQVLNYFNKVYEIEYKIVENKIIIK